MLTIMELVSVAKDCMRCHKSRSRFNKAEFTDMALEKIRELYDEGWECPAGDHDMIQDCLQREKTFLEDLSLKCMDCIGKEPLMYNEIQAYVRTLRFGMDLGKPETENKQKVDSKVFNDEKVIDPGRHRN
jgi:hypothetical protein